MFQFTLRHDDEHYTRSLDAYYANCDQHEVQMNWWRAKMPDTIAKTSFPDQPFRVLAVGTGNGKPHDKELLDMLCNSHKHVVYTVVEPSPIAVKEFQALAKNKYCSVEFRWFCMTWQDFQDKELKKEDGSQYNIIHFVQSAYFISSSVEELKERMKKCYDEMLKDGGAMVSLIVNRKIKHSLLLDMDLETFWWYSQESGMFANMAKGQGWTVDNEELMLT